MMLQDSCLSHEAAAPLFVALLQNTPTAEAAGSSQYELILGRGVQNRDIVGIHQPTQYKRSKFWQKRQQRYKQKQRPSILSGTSREVQSTEAFFAEDIHLKIRSGTEIKCSRR